MPIDDPRIDDLVRRGVWTRVEHHPTVTSTQDVALAALTDGERPGLVVVADAQSTGRGRRGRPWTDTARTAGGDPASLAVTATRRAGPDAALAPLAAGIAVADAYRAAGAEPALKWPNDVLLGGSKAAGILVERHGDVLLIGCGLDLDWRGVVHDGRTWTSLAEATRAPVDRIGVLADLLRALAAALEAPAADLVARYRRVCDTLGRTVRVTLPGGGMLEGRATDVDATGRLLVDVDGGRTAVTAGDVVHVR
jgi:BirA family transcriptional regulator, biotin operon repressor / biotin---[acetyl-CoA-carboxylase] ligase